MYPLILKELKKVFDAAKRDFILYGSAALWLEGCPRPDLSRVQAIKDLDMGTLAFDVKETEQALLNLIRGTIAGSVIDWDNPNHVFTSNQGTMEFVAADEGVQFSFSLQNLQGWSAIWKISELRRLPGTQVRILATGLRYIAAGLGGDDGMFDRTLFRSDKTLKILTYACLCLGYEVLTSRDIVLEFVKRFAEAEANEMKKQLSNISVDRHSKAKTEFHGQTQPLMDKLDTIKGFRSPPKLSESQKKVEKELAQSLDYIVGARLSRDARKKRIEEKVSEKVAALKTKNADWTPDKNTLKQLTTEAGLEVREESDEDSYALISDMLLADTLRIWEGEVGTGILIFLLDQLAVVHSIITGCKWIEEEHRARLLEGYMQLHWFVLVEIDQRLETGRHARPRFTPPLENSTPTVGSVSASAPRIGERVRVGYHLHYDVIGRVMAVTGDAQAPLVRIRVEECYEPGTQTPFRSDHTAIVLGTEMSWRFSANLFKPL
ncbi:hypothetical protein NVS55_09240 [Myxococcus stipitatus]|uniref:hypothetical protein n=1 Tax=Myxococcus stipitatus TaxID=83455 RepID=UPI0031453402